MVNQLQQRHTIAVNLLQRFGLYNVTLTRQHDGRFSYRAWNTPVIEHDGSPKTVKKGWIRVPA